MFVNGVPFNFMIGGDGLIYEGRGYFVQGEIVRDDNINDFDASGLIFAFIGNFSTEPPSSTQIEAFNSFLLQSQNRDMITLDFKLITQGQLMMLEVQDGLTEFAESHPNYYERESKFKKM